MNYFDTEKIKQAGQEFAFAFFVAFGPLLLGFLNGMHSGDRVVIPDYGTVRAFITSAFGAAALAGVKAVTWYFTGTKAQKPQN